MQLPLAVVAAVAFTSAVSGLDRYSYNPIECAWYVAPLEAKCVDRDLIKCPDGTKKVEGPSSDGMDIQVPDFTYENGAHYYAPGFGKACADGGTRIFCCKDPPLDKTRNRTAKGVPVVNCAWTGYIKERDWIRNVGVCKDGDCPDGYEEVTRTDGRSAENARTFGYSVHSTAEDSEYRYTPLAFNRPCEEGTRAFCCPKKPQYIDPPIDHEVEYANPLTCGWFPSSSDTCIGKCVKISTCPPGYVLLYRSATGRNVDPPLNLHAPAFGDKCDYSDEDSKRLDEGTKAFCCKLPLRPPEHPGIRPVNCEWKGSNAVCSFWGESYGCEDTDAFVELASTNGKNLEYAKNKDMPYCEDRGFFRTDYLPTGFGKSCDTGDKSFCCPKGKATDHRAFNALVIE